MNPRNRTRNRIALILVVAAFVVPFLGTWYLSTTGWRPQGMRNFGTLIEPPRDLSAARFVLADGGTLGWKDANWSWTVVALPGPDCAQACLRELDELRRVRLTLNRNAARVRLIVLADLPQQALASLAPMQSARDVDGVLAAYRPAVADALAVVFIDPHGFLVLSHAAGYDANKLRKDLERAIKS
ncbi:MAG: hypothetical protein K8F35_01520 [Dokdonella sp.]|uniref:hypothetical protein n=1 Tax=Dokdonella sp. TaxID=2291710 RepID=UPI0025C57BA0|nr:hypothetical protein [Dokdonella sp.]MBZ0221683.1 hypothetical protein [Dokdonella sp.]